MAGAGSARDSGATIWRHGFRPFFLGAGVWSAAALALWLLALSRGFALPSGFGAVAWHAHEMLFGFAAAAIAGFLLTAIPNWTGRLPIQGPRLALLFALWAAGRIAVAASSLLGHGLAAAVDVAFFATLCALVLREIAAGRNWRNLPMAGVLAVLALANLLTHLEALELADSGGAGQRLAIATITLLISLIGGRIVPSFTRNWLKKRGETALPRVFGWPDRATLAVTALAGLAWTLLPEAPASGILALLAGAAQGFRAFGWRGERTGAEPLVWILHLGYAWLAVGFGLLGLAILIGLPSPGTAVHALTAGAMGTMILAVMTRASLGHGGRELKAGPATLACYALVTLSVLLRLLSPLFGAAEPAALAAAGLSWIAAFGLFAAAYGPLLTGWQRR
jgi:uncharacterized protein involved in response to NO